MSTAKSDRIPALLILTHRNRRVLVPRPSAYSDAIQYALEQFPELDDDSSRVVLQTADLDICAGEMAEIAPASWPALVNVINVVHVNALPTTRQHTRTRSCTATSTTSFGEVLSKSVGLGNPRFTYGTYNTPSSISLLTASEDAQTFSGSEPQTPVNIQIDCAGYIMPFALRPSTSMSKLIKTAAPQFNVDSADAQILYRGIVVTPNDTCASLELSNGDVLQLLTNSRS